ncbi:MAG: hypothetical protein V4516_15765, partial [Pseudomonadota bacterium]
AALPAPTPDELFALAGLQFLGGIEDALQIRWRTGIQSDWSELPILRLPIPENPDAQPFGSTDFIDLIAGLSTRMDDARAALARLGTRDFALEIALGDLWFDINANGARDDGEGVSDVAGLTLGGAGRMGMQAINDPVIRFDTADGAWLSAYTNFLSAFVTLAQAYDPAPAIDRILASSEKMKAMWGTTPPSNAFDMMFGRQVDRVAMVLTALSQTPDPDLAKAAHAHLLSMITENRRFWKLVEAETDNDSEWVPNDRQVSGLGLTMPPGTGARWQAVLADAEKLLKGELLIPHWRYGAEAGINLKKLFDAPVPVNLVTWVQGEGLLPFAEKGPRASPFAWNEFTSLVQGDELLFAVFLN